MKTADFTPLLWVIKLTPFLSESSEHGQTGWADKRNTDSLWHLPDKSVTLDLRARPSLQHRFSHFHSEPHGTSTLETFPFIAQAIHSGFTLKYSVCCHSKEREMQSNTVNQIILNAFQLLVVFIKLTLWRRLMCLYIYIYMCIDNETQRNFALDWERCRLASWQETPATRFLSLEADKHKPRAAGIWQQISGLEQDV